MTEQSRTSGLDRFLNFVWIGIFSLIVAQFWSFANDVYSKEEGERLLVIVGVGASLGAVAGAIVAERVIEPFGVRGGVSGATTRRWRLRMPLGGGCLESWMSRAGSVGRRL
jgi:hypothetical protein